MNERWIKSVINFVVTYICRYVFMSLHFAYSQLAFLFLSVL